jgi:septum site-determining protein MinD
MPVVLDERSKAGQAYNDAVRRLIGEQIEMRFVAPAKRGFVQWLTRRTA